MIFLIFARNGIFDPGFLEIGPLIYFLAGWKMKFMDNPIRKYRPLVPISLFFFVQKKTL